jgi:PEP-CTERM motif
MSRGVSYPALAALALGVAIFTTPIQGSTIYNNINNAPGALPPNVQSLGYQATQTAQFGDLIQFAGTDRSLTTVTVLMSDWALASDFGSMSPTWNMPLTLNLFNVDNSGANPQPGSLIATTTQTFAIPWRPAADPTCPGGGTAWRASDNNCYNGLAVEVVFTNLAGTIVPNQIIYGLAFNTETWGAAPTGVAGPYVSLNFGGNNNAPPSVGTRPLPDTAYWNTQTAGNYADGGAGGVGTFRQDTGWSSPPPFSGAVSFDATTLSATPEPGTLAMLGMGLLGIGLVARRRRREPRA